MNTKPPPSCLSITIAGPISKSDTIDGLWQSETVTFIVTVPVDRDGYLAALSRAAQSNFGKRVGWRVARDITHHLVRSGRHINEVTIIADSAEHRDELVSALPSVVEALLGESVTALT